MLRQGIIEDSISPFNQPPIFAVKKPHYNDLRLIVDLRAINSATKCTSYRVPCVQEFIDEISKHGSKIFFIHQISVITMYILVSDIIEIFHENQGKPLVCQHKFGFLYMNANISIFLIPICNLIHFRQFILSCRRKEICFLLLLPMK